MTQGLARDAVEVGSLRRETSTVLCDSQLAPLVGGGSAVTTHCYAATALLTREYQGDYRRQAPALGRVTRQPLTNLWVKYAPRQPLGEGARQVDAPAPPRCRQEGGWPDQA